MPMQAIPLPEQFIHLLASVVLLLSFAMLAQRRIRTLIHLFALQGAALVCSTLIVAWSMSSRVEGIMRCRVMAETVWAAPSSFGKTAIAVRTLSGAGTRRRLILVKTPNVPSEPTSRRVRS